MVKRSGLHLVRAALAVAFVFLVGQPADAQQVGTITGRVTNQDTGEPLAGVQIFIAGTTRANITNADGRYIVTGVPLGQQTIRAVIIGYSQGEQMVTVAAGETAVVDFPLRLSAIELSGVIVNAVTGRAERKRELGTNTGVISAKDLELKPITKLADALTARTPGLTLQGVNGATGTSQRIRIRGANSLSLSNEPLIYVDGVQVSNSKGGLGVGGQDYSRLNDIDAETIENIEVLKGPAASALYGTAAANGVILITTKRGHAGTTQWRAYSEFGQVKDVNDYPLTYLAYQVNNPSAPTYNSLGRLNTASNANLACPNVDAARGLCTQDRVDSLDPMRTAPYAPLRTGDRQVYGLSASGGGEAVNYFLAGDWENEDGVFATNSQRKVSLRANLSTRLLDNLDAAITTNYTSNNLSLNPNDNNIFSPLINAFLATPTVPTAGDIEASGPGGRPGTGFGYFPADINEITAFQVVDHYILGANATYRPLSWLSGNVNVGLDNFARDDHQTIQPGRAPIAASYTPGRRQSIRTSSRVYTANGSLEGTRQIFTNLVSTSTIGASYNKQRSENTSCFGAGIVEGTESCGATSSLFAVDENFSEVITIGGFFQEKLSWKDRVFLAGSVRGDDNSAFGEDFGFIWYPNGSLSWVISEEPFFPTSSFLSNLRLRSAIGTSGLRPNYRDAITLLAPVAVTVGGSEISAVTLNRTGNLELEPERTTEYELGFDAGFLSDRLSLDFTYFNKESRDALISRRLAPSYGLTATVFDNLGSVKNWGTEVGVNARVFQASNAGLSFRLSTTTLDNEVVELGEGVEPIIFNRGNQRHQEGFPTGAFFAVPYTFADADGNGLLSPSEVTLSSDTAIYMGRSLPSNTQALSLDLSLLKYITVSTLFERRGGLKQLNYTDDFRCRTGHSRITRGNCAAVSDPTASLEDQAAFIATRFLGTSAGYMEDADFIKWREVSVTLGAPPAISRYLGRFSNASVTLSGRNLATWTDYTGIDPEINESGGDSNFTQGEFNTQPPVRYFTVRLNVNF